MKILCFILLSLLCTTALLAEPQPGDIFREYTFVKDGRLMLIYADSASYREQCKEQQPPEKIVIKNVDLDKAVKVEVIAEHWGGHCGSTQRSVRVNNNGLIPLPLIQNVAKGHRPECYYTNQLYQAVEIQLNQLKEGDNTLSFSVSEQTCYSFDWGWFWVYGVVLRIYYDESKPHAEGAIDNLDSNSQIGDFPEVAVRITTDIDSVDRVQFIGFYEDFDWEGNGVFRQWHYQYNLTELSYDFGSDIKKSLKYNIGTDLNPPFSVIWDTYHLPDQEKPMKIAARIVLKNGITTITPAVNNLTLNRQRKVKMYKSEDVPEEFSARIGKKKSCRIFVPDNLENARHAWITVSTWSAATDDNSVHEMGINDHKLADSFGEFHHFSYNRIPVPLEYLKPGDNEIYIYSEFEGHGLEINWPGPVLMVEF